MLECCVVWAVKVVETATGKILLQDRQTEVAADLSSYLFRAKETALQLRIP